MKNNIIKLIIIFCIVVNFPSTLAQEQFNFSITEIEIFEKGNKFRGLKRGTITTDNGISLDADRFEYDKNLNILKAFGNVIINDEINEVKIESDDIVYLRNDEKIFTNTKSKAISNSTVINANSFNYNKKLNILNAKEM